MVTNAGLADDVSLHVDYADTTPGGSALTRRAESLVREVFAGPLELARSAHPADLVRLGPEALRTVVDSPAFTRLAEREGAAWNVRPELRYPDPSAVQPRWLTVARGDGAGIRLAVGDDSWFGVHDVLARLTQGDATSSWLQSLPRDLQGVVAALDGAGLVTPMEVPLPEHHRPGVTVLGHNTVVVRSYRTAVMVDPLLFSADSANPQTYQPLPLRQIGPINAVLITHSHPDHFAPAALLRLPRETTLIVPHIERETILCFDMAARLRELGFTDVVELDWWSSHTVGDVVVTALPFYGEQPSEADVLHPDVRNSGATFHVKTPDVSAVFLADSGRDHLGDVKEMSRRGRERLGSANLVFSGYRGWITYPLQLLGSSVARYLLFVPPNAWGARHSLMTTAEEAVTIAEVWGADLLVPYADGGAPWHWRIGLGPVLDGTGTENVGFDPFPERVAEAAANRVQAFDGSMVPSSVEVRVLRPNDILRPGTYEVDRLPGFSWPGSG
jgi:L-ascorbate metabolism protein UlaG (beta-lactamase superfamily)